MKHNYSNQRVVPLVLEQYDYRPLLYAFLVLASFLFGTKPGLAQSTDSQSWVLHSKSGDVSVYYKYSTCEQQDVVLLKFYNAGNSKLEVSWKEKFTINGTDIYVNNSEYKKLLILPGETVADDCTASAAVLVTPANKYVSLLMPGLTGFEVYDFVIVTHK